MEWTIYCTYEVNNYYYLEYRVTLLALFAFFYQYEANSISQKRYTKVCSSL